MGDFMRKKVVKSICLLVFIAIVIIATFNTYNWIVSGKQCIKINTSSKAYTESDLYVSIIAQNKGVDLDTKTNLKLLDSKGKTLAKLKSLFTLNLKITYKTTNAKDKKKNKGVRVLFIDLFKPVYIIWMIK